MPEILINIDVPDIQAATHFYTEGLSLTVGRTFDAGFVELLGASAKIYLLQQPEGSQPLPGRASARSYRRHWCPLHLDIAVADLAVTSARVLELGAIREGGPVEKPYGKIAYFADPFGHGFCLIEFSSRGYDALLETQAVGA